MPEITSKTQLPDAPYFVLSNDRFMSGWGHAQGKINTIILPCRTMSEAMIVEAHAKARGDQRRVRIVSGKPNLRPSRVYYSLHNWEDYSTWYTGYVTITRRISDKDYPFEVHLEGAGFDRLGFKWGGLHKDFWGAFSESMRIASQCHYYTVKVELTAKL